MSNTDKPWEKLNINVNDFTNDEWGFLERRFDKLGTPGFTELIIPVKAPHMLGHALEVDAKVDLYRGEDGQLLCVYISYVENNVVKPFMLIVHPDYQRQGIATMVINHSREEFAFEQGHEYNISEGLTNINTTTAAATWAKKYIENL
jgi:GNAT superfamily N-acetyltransferase